LSGRLQCTKVGDIFSPYRHLSSGVIQGLLLFVIGLYVNDVVSLFGEDCVCKLYADDMKLYMRMNSSSSSYCASRLQNYLDKLGHWSRIWQLNIAYQMCRLVISCLIAATRLRQTVYPMLILLKTWVILSMNPLLSVVMYVILSLVRLLELT